MRYSHRYHQLMRHGRRHRRRVSYGVLLLIILTLWLVLRTPFELHQLVANFALSLVRVIAAYLSALALALLIGLAAVSTLKIEGLLLPVLDLAQSFPTFAILPILVFYFGRSSVSVVVILVIAMIWPIVFAIISGVKEQREDQSEAARIYGATGWRYLAFYRLPMLKPSIVTGSVVSWGQAWDTIVGAEIIAGVTGAGRYLGNLGSTGRSGSLVFGIAIYLFLIFTINQLFWLPLLHCSTKFQAES